LQCHVLAAAAADAVQRLSIGASVAPAYGGVECPRKRVVQYADCSAGQVEVVDYDRVVTNQCQNATENSGKPQQDEHSNDCSGQIDSLELTTL